MSTQYTSSPRTGVRPNRRTARPADVALVAMLLVALSVLTAGIIVTLRNAEPAGLGTGPTPTVTMFDPSRSDSTINASAGS